MTQEEAIKQALAKAGSDNSFKSLLMADPTGTLSKEFPGVDFDNNISLDIELSDDDLDNVSGGMSGSTSGSTSGGGDDSSDDDDDDSGCTRGTGYGNSGQGQQKGQGQNNGQGQGLNSD